MLANLTAHPVETWVQGLAGAWRARELEVGNARGHFTIRIVLGQAGQALWERDSGRPLRIEGYGVVVADLCC